MSSSLQQLFDTLPQRGRVVWLGIRGERRAALLTREAIQVDPAAGLIGDHYAGRSGKRQVTLIQAEHTAVVASLLERGSLDYGLLRRNVVVSGINLLALMRQRFHIGGALLETTGPCHPCSRMESNLGAGGYNAMRGHGGITARVLVAGTIRLGDDVRLALDPA